MKKKTVFVLSTGAYSDFDVNGVTTDREVAEAWEKINDHSMQEFVLDEIELPSVGYNFSVDMTTGELVGPNMLVEFEGNNINVYNNIGLSQILLKVTIAGNDIEHAKRAAFDLRGKLLALYEGTPPYGVYNDDLSIKYQWKP